MNTLTRCISCTNQTLVTQKQQHTLTVSNYTFEAALPVIHCNSCSENYWDGQAIERFELMVAAWLAKEGVSSGESFKFMRKVLGLRAVELANLLDVAPETLSRWEQGHRSADRKALSILGSLVIDQLEGHHTTLDRLQALQKPSQRFVDRIDLTSDLAAV